MIQGPSQLEWLPGIMLDTPLPKRTVPKSRQYSNVVFETNSLLIVAASSLQAQFASYDEDNNLIWEPDGAYHILSFHLAILNLHLQVLEFLYPFVTVPRWSSSHLMAGLLWMGTWTTFSRHNCLDILRYEFAPNEYINALECVTLETFSTETGTKEFIAVGTSIDRGEDLAVKGAVGSLLERTMSEPLIIPSRHTYLRLWRLYLSSQTNDGTDSNCEFATMPRVRLQRFAVLTDI